MRRARAFTSWILTAAAMCLALLSAAPAWADPSSDATQEVIEQQLDAFSRDAWDEAYGFAAPSIKRIFPSADAFANMVRGGYPMVWRNSSVEFLESGPAAGGAQYEQILRIVDQDGRSFLARYTLAEIDGAWRITGVMIREEENLSA